MTNIFKRIGRLIEAFNNALNQHQLDQGAKSLDKYLCAAESGDIKTLERFFPKNNSTRLCEKLQALGLIVASAHGQKETVKFFLKHNVPHTAKVTGWGYDGKTAMSVAFENGHTEIVQMILDDFAEKLKNKLKNKRPSPDR